MNRRFRLVVFDWDGTAVVNRAEDATPLRKQLERLLADGVWIVVVTGTGLAHVDRQLTGAMMPGPKYRLVVCANRGSEVFAFDPSGQPVLRWRRTATPGENRQLTAIAEEVAANLRDTYGLNVRLILDRPNRRKIDLIPVPEWAEPAKSAIGELLRAVEERLRRAGIPGGLSGVVDLVRQAVSRAGLSDARITSDAKHIEVGLTDKGDAMAWAVRAIAGPERVLPAETLVVGDEFGAIGGLPGSDALMMAPAPGSVVVSVGVEPTPVPAGVLHLGGGPPRFRALLDEQVRLRETAPAVGPPRRYGGSGPASRDLFALTEDPRWHLVEEGFDVVREHEVEALFTTGNGAVAVQGGLAEGSMAGFPVTLVAGFFDTLPESGALPELAVAPNWTWRRVSVEGNDLIVDRGELLAHRRTLDLRRGILVRDWRHCDAAGRITSVRCLRFVSLADRWTLVQVLQLLPENYTGRVVLETGVDGTVTNAEGVDHLEPVPNERSGDTLPAVVLRTRGRGDLIACATATERDDVDGDWRREASIAEPEVVRERWVGQAAIAQPQCFATVASMATTRDTRSPAQDAAEACRRARQIGVAALLEAHVDAWEERWAAAGVEIDGDDAAQRAIRFATYHLIAAANPFDPRVSIGARGLTGEAYKGHVFWETEIYLLPFYTFTWPDAARALLTYRFLTLPAARARARSLGYQGALWAWEATDTGEDATPPLAVTPRGEIIPVLTARQEHHIAADIAYATWQYWQATGDDTFFAAMGVEMILEAARFWASRAVADERGAYHIPGVIGPDEYHVGVDDNAYTNALARWTLERAAEALRLVARRWPEHYDDLTTRLELMPDEEAVWRDVAGRLVGGADPGSGLIEQFAGYCALEDLDLRAFEPRVAPVDILLGHERVARTQVIKQADVVLLLYLLWDRFLPSVRTANFRYYEPRTAHGSSLSPSVYVLVAARLGDVGLAERYFAQAGAIDLQNNMGNAAGGVHMGALGGLWQAVVFGFGGVYLQPESETIVLDPHLPLSWQSLSFPLQFRGRRLHVAISVAGAGGLQVRLEDGDPLAIRVAGGDVVRLAPGQVWRASRRSDTLSW